MNSTRSADASRDVVLDSLRLSSPQGAPAGGAPRGASSKQQKDEWGEAWERLSNLGYQRQGPAGPGSASDTVASPTQAVGELLIGKQPLIFLSETA